MNKDDHRQEVLQLNHKSKPLAKVMRMFCYDCQAQNWHAVAQCKSKNCALWDYRLGFNPFNKKTNNPKISRIGSNVLKNIKGQYKLNGQPVQDLIKGEKAMNICQIPEMPLSASNCVKPQNGISDVKSRMLYFLYDRLKDNKLTFFQSEIENIHTAEFHTGETKARKYRQLNLKHGLSECIDRHKSIHRIKKTLQELDGILKGYGL